MLTLLTLVACPVTDPSADEFEGDESGECVDAADNDQDGTYDCDDADCAASPDCASDTAADTDTAGDTDTDTDTDTGPCAPPDSWTGGVNPALYTTSPYDASYDAGLAAMVPYMPETSSTSSSDLSWLVYGATVTAVSQGTSSCVDSVYIADANWTVVVADEYGCATAAVGDKVGFGTNNLGGYYGERRVPRLSGWTVLSSANPVYVRELGAESLDYLSTFSQLTHTWGELTRASSYDCDRDRECYILDHNGQENLVRVPADDTFGLVPDYAGGRCVEIVAPVSIHMGSDGDATFLDVREADWMRVWAME